MCSTYGRAELLPRLLGALAAQTFPADELEVSFTPHQGRIGEALFRDTGVVLPTAGAGARVAYVCGPEEFERWMLDLLDRHGVRGDAVIRESFEY